MFGIKIISEKKYNQMNELVERHIKAHAKERNEYVRAKSDLESIRQRLNDEIDQRSRLSAECNRLRQFKRDTLEALADIDLGSFRLSLCRTKCDKCNHEHPDCKKYTFGKLTFCEFPKE